MNWAQKTGFLFLTLNFVFCVSDFSEEPSVDSDNDVVIPTASGYLRGVRIPTKSGFLVDYFKGVPFAEKPIRLRKSQLVHRWNSVYNAQEYPPKCIPVSRPSNDSEYSEDCLYMNILKPSGLNTINKLPVVVFIHGGGFQEGDGNDASCEAFAENFVSKGMVVITIQYRLAMLGFLSLGCTDPLIPCNLGLWDMVTAFQFINKTISDFNGDINNMTLMGHSAGSMAVSLHSISPISSIYFKKFIQMSGSSWSLTRYKTQNVQVTKQILHDLNCNISSSKQIFECVSSVSLDSMYSAQINTNLWPEFGDDLLPDIPDILVNNTKDQKVLMGVMTLEALYFTYLKSSPEIFPYILNSTVQEYINDTIANQYGINSESAFDMLTNYYLTANVSSNDYGYFMTQRSKIDSNMIFDIAILREAKARSQISSNLFFYHFSYFNPAEFDTDFPVKATYHCQEFPYIWGVYKDNYFNFDDDDRQVSVFLIDSLTNFIITGDPSSSQFTWKRYDSEVSHTIIQPKPTTGKNLFQSDYNFWSSMSLRFKFDIISGLSVGSDTETTTSSSSIKLKSLILFFIAIILLS